MKIWRATWSESHFRVTRSDFHSTHEKGQNMSATKTSGKRGGHHPYTPLAHTIEDDRYLLNWLSTRAEEDSRQVRSFTAYAHAMGLTVKPGRYIAPGELKHTPSQLQYSDFLRSQRRRAA